MSPRQEANLQDAILIGLVGGTGVGKSTIINALAGQQVSRSGDRRPTTSRVVIYRHGDTELPDDIPLADVAQPQVLHTRESLTKVILFDFPDFDSAESSHAEIVQRYLPHLDVLVCGGRRHEVRRPSALPTIEPFGSRCAEHVHLVQQGGQARTPIPRSS